MSGHRSLPITSSSAQRMVAYKKPMSDLPRSNTTLLAASQSDAFCDSGINSLISEKTILSLSDQKSQSCSRSSSSACPHLSSLVENPLEKIKAYFLSDKIPDIKEPEYLTIRDKPNFVTFTKCLIEGLRMWSAECEESSSGDPKYDQMKIRNTVLTWKTEKITRLLEEYERCLKELSDNRQVISYNTEDTELSGWRRKLKAKMAFPTKLSLPSVVSPENTRLCEIEKQISGLAGALHLRNPIVNKVWEYPFNINSCKLRVAIEAQQSIKTAAAEGVFYASNLVPLWNAEQRKSPVSSVAPREWLICGQKVGAKESSLYILEEPDITCQSSQNFDSWSFSPPEFFLPVEPCGVLVGGVSSVNRIREAHDVKAFLTPAPHSILIPLTAMKRPSVQIEVQWVPLLQRDRIALEKDVTSGTFVLNPEFTGDGKGGPQDMSSLPIAKDRRRQCQEGEDDRDGGFDSMRSEPIGCAGSLSSPSTTAFVEEGKDHLAADAPSPLQSCKTASECSICDHETASVGEEEGEDLDHSGDEEAVGSCRQPNNLRTLLNLVKLHSETISRKSNRYSTILEDLYKVIEDLQEVLLTSTPINVQETADSDPFSKPLSVDEVDSLSVLNQAIGDTPSESRTFPLTSGWVQLDSVIKWHLNNVDLLLQNLSSSDNIFGSLRRDPIGTGKSRLFIYEDLLAMALGDQSQILSDITGLVMSYQQASDPTEVILNSHCLAHCGSTERSQGSWDMDAHLLPVNFWLNLVWQTTTLPRKFEFDGTSTPLLMIEDNKLYTFLLTEYASLNADSEDEQPLEKAIDSLLELITDYDLTNASPGRKIPLTQICYRLRPQDFTILRNFNITDSRLGSLNRRSLASRSSVALALEYLMGEESLRRELRESDKEKLSATLENLEGTLKFQRKRGDRSSALPTMSVESFTCLSLRLLDDDSSIGDRASQVICAVRDLMERAYDIILQKNSLPFLRADGPCCSFAKTLEMFSQKLLPKNSQSNSSRYLRRNSPTTKNSLLPVDIAILWGLQSPNEYDCRLAALTAWKCFLTSSKTNECRQRRRGNCRSVQMSPIQGELWFMTVADSSGDVRRRAQQILIAHKRFSSSSTSLAKANDGAEVKGVDVKDEKSTDLA